MGLPRPDPFEFPDTPEQALSDFLLHAGVSAGTVIGVYAYTGLYAGPGHMGILYHAFLSPAHVGARGAGTVALSDTIYALSVYAEPFVAVGRVLGPVAAAVTVVAAGVYIGHKVMTTKQSDPWHGMLQTLGRNISMSGP